MVNKIFQNSSEIRSFIIDSEIVAVNSTDGTLKSFQDLSNRARKDVAISDVKIAVAVFAFDIMYLNGEVQSLSTSNLHPPNAPQDSN
jgi:DNA ligase-1